MFVKILIVKLLYLAYTSLVKWILEEQLSCSSGETTMVDSIPVPGRECWAVGCYGIHLLVGVCSSVQCCVILG